MLAPGRGPYALFTAERDAFLTAFRVHTGGSAERPAKEGKTSEERAQHPQEPAEGSEETVEARGAERPKEGERTAGAPAEPGRSPQKPAEGSEEAVEAGGAGGPAKEST